MASIKVAVRVRPLNDRERSEDPEGIVEIQGKTVTVTDRRMPIGSDCDHRQRVHRFNFDYCYRSADSGSPRFLSQHQIYEELGKEVLRETINGYNCCLFAYGQSGSGKTYSMMGNATDPGLIPLICQGMFQSKTEAKRLTLITDMSGMEIYNEKVYDLLAKRESRKGLRVREHPVHGPYVDGLSRYVVQDVPSVVGLIERIAEKRKTCTSEESRKGKYHTIFTIRCSQILTDDDNLREVNSKLHLVDLAASERADLQLDHARLKEGSNINKSLTTLGIVISSLAGRERNFAPYRDSVLTWLLKDSVGGNSFTFMLAAISPSSSSCSETISTLRYAQNVKRIINRPVINEAPTKRLLRQLKCEVNHLKEAFIQTNSGQKPEGVVRNTTEELKGRLELDPCLDGVDGDPIVECQPNLEVEAHLTVRRRSNLSMDGKMPDSNRAGDDTNSFLSPTFTGTLTSNYMVMLKDKISKQKQGNYVYRRLPFKISSIDPNCKRRRHSDTDISPSNLSQNFAIFRAAFARNIGTSSGNCHQAANLNKSDNSNAAGIDFSIDSLKYCGKNDSSRPLAEGDFTKNDLGDIEDNCANEDRTKCNSLASEICYSLDSLAQSSASENVMEETNDEPREVSPSTSTDSITFVFLSKESAQTTDNHSDAADQNLSPRTLSVDSLFAEELLNQFRYRPPTPTSVPKNASTPQIEENFQDNRANSKTINKSKTQFSPVKSNESDRPKSEVSCVQLFKLMSDVVGLLKSGTAACKCKQMYSKSYLRHLVEFRKQMVDTTINRRPKYRVVSRNIYSCFSSESSMSGGFSSTSYLGTNNAKCQRNPASRCDKRYGSIKAKWRSDSGAVCSGSDSSDAGRSNSDKSGAPSEKNACFPVIGTDTGCKTNEVDNTEKESKGVRLFRRKSVEADVFPVDDYLRLPHLLKSTTVNDIS